jgi:hypothetical protein
LISHTLTRAPASARPLPVTCSTKTVPAQMGILRVRSNERRTDEEVEVQEEQMIAALKEHAAGTPGNVGPLSDLRV